MIYAAIDYSMTCPSISIADEDCQKFSCFYRTEKVKYATTFQAKNFTFHGSWIEPWETPMERFEGHALWAFEIINAYNISLVFIEGYSYGSNKGRAFEIAENTSILKYILYKHGIEAIPIAPTAVKKFAGSGRADKNQMEEFFGQQTGIDLRSLLDMPAKATSPSGDIIDSYFLLQCGIAKERQSKEIQYTPASIA